MLLVPPPSPCAPLSLSLLFNHTIYRDNLSRMLFGMKKLAIFILPSRKNGGAKVSRQNCERLFDISPINLAARTRERCIAFYVWSAKSKQIASRKRTGAPRGHSGPAAGCKRAITEQGVINEGFTCRGNTLRGTNLSGSWRNRPLRTTSVLKFFHFKRLNWTDATNFTRTSRVTSKVNYVIIA